MPFMRCLDENETLDCVLGKVSPQRRAAIDRHVAACAECQELMSVVVCLVLVLPKVEGSASGEPEPEAGVP